MIAARFAAMVVVLGAAARSLAGPDAGANADAGVPDADVDAAPARDAAGAGHDATVGGDTVLADAGTDASATPTVPLRGRVLEKGTRKPIAGATVVLDGALAGETGAAGKFELRVVPGSHHLQIQTAGYDTGDRRVDVGPTPT